MITIDGQPSVEAGDKFKFDLVGLSTDTKPTKTYNGHKIANGSTFLNIDTASVNFYDESSNTWV